MSSISTTTSSPPTFASLPFSLLSSVLAPFLSTTDLLSVSSCSREVRRLLLSPPLWRHWLFSSFRPRTPLPSSSNCPLPSWCDAVQLVDTDARPRRTTESRPQPVLAFSLLSLFPNLRHVRLNRVTFSTNEPREPDPGRPITTLTSLRQLTRLSLNSGGQLSADDLRLLVSLPALASFAVLHVGFQAGDERTMKDWLALTAQQRSRGRVERKAEEGHRRDAEEQEDVDNDDGVADEGERRAEEETDVALDDKQLQQDHNDLGLPMRHSALLLFLHHLAAKPPLAHLQLRACGLTPFVMDHMPVWPHLLCLSVEYNPELRSYTFDGAAARWPSLTSLSCSNSSDAAIAQFVQLPALEELRFSEYRMTRRGERCVRTTGQGFRALNRAASLRSLQFSPEHGYHDETPSLASLTCVFIAANLTRLSVLAFWLSEELCLQLLTPHRFVHLRCLELVEQPDGVFTFYPQTDAALLPLVKPAVVVVPGRQGRQALRAVKRRNGEINVGLSDGAPQLPDIPHGNVDNFPALECLALPYTAYQRNLIADQVSRWTVRQLRRSYEYEVVEEWEAERSTLGQAELLKTMA